LVNGDLVRNEIVNLVPNVATHAMLNEKIRAAHDLNRSAYAGLPFVKLLAQGVATSDAIEPITIFEISGADLLANQEVTLKEVFGPTAVVVNCQSNDEALAIANAFHGTLASGIHGEASDKIISLGLLDILVRISGRVIWNSWPTGVAVTWAMHHGGPYPASTNSLFTSVGADSIKRFRRPVVFQNMPTELLPTELK
jgi:NADP-dependent aldehyde dehydrogenase